jgi:chromosomal replication initiation ATPase DnaA
MQTLIKSDEININDLVNINIITKKVVLKFTPKIIKKPYTQKRRDLTEEERRIETFKAHLIISKVCEFYKLKWAEIINNNHEAPFIKAKHQSISLIYTNTELGERLIGNLFGLNHSSVNYIKKRVDSDMAYPLRKREFDDLKEKIKELHLNP